MSTDKYRVSVEEAAERLGVSKRTVYRRLNDNLLDGMKKRTSHGDKWFISEDEFSDQAEVIKEVIETERKMNVAELKEELKNTFLEVQQEMIEEVLDQQRQAITEDIKEELKKEGERLDSTVSRELDKFQSTFEETAASIPQTIKNEQQEHREWINQRDRKLMRNIRRMQRKDKYEQEQKERASLIHKLANIFK
ncbi:MAG: helix-turn-helix domain-containing protein [Bacillota bacterium]